VVEWWKETKWCNGGRRLSGGTVRETKWCNGGRRLKWWNGGRRLSCRTVGGD